MTNVCDAKISYGTSKQVCRDTKSRVLRRFLRRFHLDFGTSHLAIEAALHPFARHAHNTASRNVRVGLLGVGPQPNRHTRACHVVGQARAFGLFEGGGLVYPLFRPHRSLGVCPDYLRSPWANFH